MPALIQALRDEDVRSNAAMTLTHEISQGNIGPEVKDVIPTLTRALKDQDVGVRCRAASALGRIGGGAVDAVPALIQLLQDQSSDVRLNAAGALKNIGTPEALKAVKEYQSQQ